MGTSLVAKDLVLVLLGNQWVSAIPFVQWLAIHYAFWSMVQSMQPYFLVTKRERLMTLCYATYVAILVPSIVVAAHISSVEAVAITRTFVTGLFLVGMLGVLCAMQIFSPAILVSFLWRPLIATAVMAIGILYVDPTAPPIVLLILRVVTGVAIFPTVLVVLWGAAGRPDGLERAIFRLISDYTGVARDRPARV